MWQSPAWRLSCSTAQAEVEARTRAASNGFGHTWWRLGVVTELSPRVRRHQVVRTIVDDKLAIVLAAVLDGERPDGGVVGHAVAEKFRCMVQPRIALLLNDLRSVSHGFLNELNHVGLGLELVTGGIVALAEVGSEV